MVDVVHLRTNLVLVFDIGPDEFGKPVKKRVNLSNVRYDLTKEEISQFGSALGALSKHTYLGIERITYEEVLG